MARLQRGPRRGALLLAAVAVLGLPLAGCAPPRIAARAALEQFLQDVHGHQSAYAYTLLAPDAATSTTFNAFNDAVLAGRASFQVISVHSTSPSSARAVVRAGIPGGPHRRLALTVVEVGTAGDWMVAAPFTTEGAAVLRRLDTLSA